MVCDASGWGGRYPATYAGLVQSTFVGVRLEGLRGRVVRLGLGGRSLRLRLRDRLRGGDLRLHCDEGNGGGREEGGRFVETRMRRERARGVNAAAEALFQEGAKKLFHTQLCAETTTTVFD